MYDPDQNEKETEELILGLPLSHYGLRRNPDGLCEIVDLELVRSFPEETKRVLRQLVKPTETRSQRVSHSAQEKIEDITLRQRLDTLYKQLDSLDANAVRSRYFKQQDKDHSDDKPKP